MSKVRYKITLDILSEEPYLFPDKTIYKDIFVYGDRLVDDVLKENFNDMIKLLHKGGVDEYKED